jgi:hypothetical protein
VQPQAAVGEFVEGDAEALAGVGGEPLLLGDDLLDQVDVRIAPAQQAVEVLDELVGQARGVGCGLGLGADLCGLAGRLLVADLARLELSATCSATLAASRLPRSSVFFLAPSLGFDLASSSYDRLALRVSVVKASACLVERP